MSKSRRHQGHDRLILAIACVAQFMVVLDVSIVTVALPSIGRDLHYSATGLQWVVNAYVLTFAGFLLLGGRAADLFGQRRVYLTGMTLFTVASLAGGFATDSAWLTSARDRKRPNLISGAPASRSSMIANTASSTTAAASSDSVRALPHGYVPVPMIA